MCAAEGRLGSCGQGTRAVAGRGHPAGCRVLQARTTPPPGAPSGMPPPLRMGELRRESAAVAPASLGGGEANGS